MYSVELFQGLNKISVQLAKYLALFLVVQLTIYTHLTGHGGILSHL